MRLPILEERERYTAGMALFGIVVMLLGSTDILPHKRYRYWHPHWPWAVDQYSLGDVAFVVVGAGMLVVGGVRWLLAMQAIRAWDAKTGGDWYARATLPRSIFQLLLTVASADGRVDGCEGERIETFLVRSMQKGVIAGDLRNWAKTVRPAPDPRRLAQGIGRLLGEGERAQLYGWCEEVALADGGIDDDEREVLEAIAQGLQLPARAARSQ